MSFDGGLDVLAGAAATDATTAAGISFCSAAERDAIIDCALQRCQMRRSPDAALFVCQKEDCVKRIHHDCFLWLCKERSTMEVDPENRHHHFCSANCYKKHHKPPTKPTASQLCWDNDGSPGTGVSSQQIIVDWLTTEGNYQKYRGDSHGRTKISIAGDIARLIGAGGILVPRDAHMVMGRISLIESSFRKAYEWTLNTGAGITCEQSIREYITKLCPHYYELLPIFQDNPSTQPLATNFTSDGSDSDDSIYDSDDETPVLASLLLPPNPVLLPPLVLSLLLLPPLILMRLSPIRSLLSSYQIAPVLVSWRTMTKHPNAISRRSSVSGLLQ